MWYTKEEASKKYPDVVFEGDVCIEIGVVIESDVIIGSGVVIQDGVEIGVHVAIGNDVIICNDVEIGDGVIIRDRAKIGVHVAIGNGVEIGYGATIGEGVILDCGTVIESQAAIDKNRTGVSDCLVVAGNLDEAATLTAFKCDDGLIIKFGYFNDYRGGTPDELREAVAKKYDEDHFYFKAIDLIEAWYEGLK